MREILFRGKLKAENGELKKGDWVYGDFVTLIDGKEKHLHIYGKGEVKAETIGQFTGLSDKNGTNIFEGDIIKCRHEWAGSNKDKNQSFNIDDLFEMVNTTNDDLQQQFESQNIRGAYGKHTEQICLGQRYLYYRNYVVEYYAPNGRYRVRNGSVFYDITSSFLSNRNAEVIGNIHDNPELLESEVQGE